jgi:GT2 family glycosyltransferase
MKNIVSTITSCYKAKPYLKLFLEQLPLQTYFKNLEIVLAHNEPEKEEIRLIENFQTQYPNKIKHIIFKKVTPLGVSWNECIKTACGDFLTIWNIDDLRTPKSIESQSNLLSNNLNTNIVYGNYIVVDSFGKTTGKLIEHKNIPDSEFARSMVWGPFFMFRKSLLKKTGYFDEQFKSALDLDFCIRASTHGEAKFLDENLGYFLNAGKGLSTRPDSLNNAERTTIELRYGIYDKIDYNQMPKATTNYSIPYLLQNNKWKHVSHFISKYELFIENKKKQKLIAGIKSFYKNHKRQYSRITGIKKFIKKLIKKFL